jgi:hypothetical protein
LLGDAGDLCLLGLVELRLDLRSKFVAFGRLFVQAGKRERLIGDLLDVDVRQVVVLRDLLSVEGFADGRRARDHDLDGL